MIAASIRESGFVMPVLITADDELITGKLGSMQRSRLA